MTLSPETAEVFAADLLNAMAADKRQPEAGGVYLRTTLQRHADYAARFEAARVEFALLPADRQRDIWRRLDDLCAGQHRRDLSGSDGYAGVMEFFQRNGVPSLVGFFRHDREFLAEEFRPLQQQRAA